MPLIPCESDQIKTGQRFGRLTVLSTHHNTQTFRKVAKCLCDCGAQKIVQFRNLRDGLTQSCGCLQKETATKHGVRKHPLYVRWWNMMNRCYNPSASRYHRYGGRGIIVCERWHNASNFISDMGQGYTKGMQIDRINNNKGYSPENCRWVSNLANSQNRNDNIKIKFQGNSLTLAEWSRVTGIRYTTLYQRLFRNHWSVKKSLSKLAR